MVTWTMISCGGHIRVISASREFILPRFSATRGHAPCPNCGDARVPPITARASAIKTPVVFRHLHLRYTPNEALFTAPHIRRRMHTVAHARRVHFAVNSRSYRSAGKRSRMFAPLGKRKLQPRASPAALEALYSAPRRRHRPSRQAWRSPVGAGRTRGADHSALRPARLSASAPVHAARRRQRRSRNTGRTRHDAQELVGLGSTGG